MYELNSKQIDSVNGGGLLFAAGFALASKGFSAMWGGACKPCVPAVTPPVCPPVAPPVSPPVSRPNC